MKKAAEASPNYALKRERKLRCWSQLEVANQIGTTAFNVSRWERGITSPSSYFRQQLCAIFGKSPQELGFFDTEDERQLFELHTNQHVRKETSACQHFSDKDKHTRFEYVISSKRTHDSTISLTSTQPAPNGSIPAIWNVPYRRNLFFTGHEDILQTLHSAFQSKEKGIIPALAISGLSGIGKTQTALEYIYRYRHEYQAVLWCRAQTLELLTTDFTSIAALLELPERYKQNHDCTVVAVKRWLSRETGWLLVMDNANDLEMVSDFLPELPVGHLLLTTCSQHTAQIARCIPLEKLSREESILFLLQRAKLLENSCSCDVASADCWSQARAIAEMMDGLPLALDQAAAYIEETNCGLRGYAERYQQRKLALLSRRGGCCPDHPESIAATWSLSLAKIAQTHPAAAELLRLCAFLHPDAIAEEMLREGCYELTPHLHLLATDPFELDAAIGTLTKFSLVRRNPEGRFLTLHRLVQTVLSEQMDEETRALWAERAGRCTSFFRGRGHALAVKSQ